MQEEKGFNAFAHYPIASERYKNLPDAPGVYRFLRSNCDVLYVGKAASLRKRVASHFIGRASKLLAPEMLNDAREFAGRLQKLPRRVPNPASVRQ